MPQYFDPSFQILKIWMQGSGATGYVASEICFSKIFEKHFD